MHDWRLNAAGLSDLQVENSVRILMNFKDRDELMDIRKLMKYHWDVWMIDVLIGTMWTEHFFVKVQSFP